MRSPICPFSRLALRSAFVFSIASIVLLTFAGPAFTALESGPYQTLSGATVVERGDRVTNEIRVVPICTTLTFDLNLAQPSVTAWIPNAVLEGGAPFPLTVRSLSGEKLMDGSYRFSGDYLRDIYPAGTQYLFHWTFAPTADGRVLWNGMTFWAGGHLWDIAISNLTLVPQARLSIARGETNSLQMTWSTNFSDHFLEYADSVPSTGWGMVTNAVTVTGDRISLTVDASASQRFYRLRKP
jgi:hypothetical protein